MFISRKELKEIRETLKAQNRQIEGLKQSIKALKETNKKQAELNKKYDDSLGKRYIHEAFDGKSVEEQASMIDEWFNGAKKKEGDK